MHKKDKLQICNWANKTNETDEADNVNQVKQPNQEVENKNPTATFTNKVDPSKNSNTINKTSNKNVDKNKDESASTASSFFANSITILAFIVIMNLIGILHDIPEKGFSAGRLTESIAFSFFMAIILFIGSLCIFKSKEYSKHRTSNAYNHNNYSSSNQMGSPSSSFNDQYIPSNTFSSTTSTSSLSRHDSDPSYSGSHAWYMRKNL